MSAVLPECRQVYLSSDVGGDSSSVASIRIDKGVDLVGVGGWAFVMRVLSMFEVGLLAIAEA